MKIHYFQRYHSKENVDTGNALLLLSRLYHYSADKFFALLKSMALDSSIEPEIEFRLQEVGEASVPDGTITQNSFKIAIETKLDNNFRLQQLENHLKCFSNETSKVLLTLDPLPMKKDTFENFTGILEKYNRENHCLIMHRNITFQGLIQEIRNVLASQDYEFLEILADYEEYCFTQGLIIDDWKWLRALTAGTTFGINMKLKLYYDGADRGFSRHAYIGLYRDKAVRAIGKVINTAVVSLIDGKLVVEEGEATEDQLERVKMAIDDAVRYGWDNSLHQRYFFVDNFFPTVFKKTTPNPIMRSKYFDLTKYIAGDGKLPETVNIAEMLDGRAWED